MSKMNVIKAVLAMLALSAIAVGFDASKLGTFAFLIFVSSLWAALDAETIQARNYQTGLPRHQIGLFLVVLMVWVIGFPWYPVVRWQILEGRAKPLASTSAAPRRNRVEPEILVAEELEPKPMAAQGLSMKERFAQIHDDPTPVRRQGKPRDLITSDR